MVTNWADRPPEQENTQKDRSLLAAVAARTRWGVKVVSPWVQRHLLDGVRPEAEQIGLLSRYARAALSASDTDSLINRIQRISERSTVWKPDVGSRGPATVDRFTEHIVSRFPETVNRYDIQPMVLDTDNESTELVLVGALGEAPGRHRRQSAPVRDESPSLAAIKQMLQEKGRDIPPSGFPPPAPTSVQREESPSVRDSSLSQTLPSRPRLYSRVEEVTAGGKGSVELPSVTGVPVSQPQRQEPAPSETGSDESESIEFETQPAMLPSQPSVERVSVDSVSTTQREPVKDAILAHESPEPSTRVVQGEWQIAALPGPTIVPPALPLADQHPPEPSPSNMPMPSGTRLPETTVPVVQSDLSEEIAPSTVLPVPPIGVIQEERQVSTPHEFVSQDLPLAALATPVAVRRQPEAGPPGVPTPSMTKVPEIIAPVVQRKPSEETTPLSVSAEPRVEAVQEEKKVVVPSALSLAVPAAPDVVQRQPETGLSSAPTEPPVGAVLEEKEAAESSALSLAAPAAPDVVQRQPETGLSSVPTSLVAGVSGIIAPVVQRKPSEETTPLFVPTEPSARAVQEEKEASESSALPLAAPAAPDVVQRQPETGLSSAPTPPITGSPAISVPAVQSGPFEETTPSSVPTEPPVGAVQEEKEAAESSALSLAAPAAPDVVQRQPETGPSSAPTSPVTGASGIIAPVVQRKPSEGTTPSSVPTEPSARAVQEEKEAAESSALSLAAPAAPDVVQRQPETGPSSAPTPPITGSPEISVPAVQSGPFEETTPSSVPTEPPARVVQKEKAAAVPAALPLVAPIAPAVIQRRLEAIPPGTPVPSDTLVSSDLPVSGVSVPAVLQQLEQETLPTQVVGSPSGTGTGDLFLPSVSPQRPGMAVTVMDQLVQRQSVQEQSPPLALHSDVSPKSVIQTRSVERTTILPLAQIQRQTEREQRVRPGVRPSPLSRFSSEVQAEPLPVAAGVTAPSITQGVRFDAGLSSSLEASERLPLPLTSTPPFAGAIQRQIKDVPISSFESSDTANAIQRVETTSLEMGAAPEEQAGPDLDRLAKEVYPRIKRMLAVERERRTCRWR